MRIRLDELLVQRNLASSIKEAQAKIHAGLVVIDDQRSDKPGNMHNVDVDVRIKKKLKYVSRGGLKLEKALQSFGITVDNSICADIGASTGGFTDCLLQHGAKLVYAVDVAYGQFSWNLRQDRRVIVLERCNARKISRSEVQETLHLAVIDASFISLTKLIPPLLPLLDDHKSIIALIKPQFELPKEKIPKGGVIKDPSLHQEVIEKIKKFAENMGLSTEGVVESPILGPKGNKEFLIYMAKQ